MNDLSDHFQTAGVMAHMLRHKPDGYEAECAALLARTEGETRGRVQAYLEAGVVPVVIEALMGCDKLTGENVKDVAQLQRTYGAGLLAAIFRGDEPYRTPLPTVAAPRVPRVTLDERRAKRRERRGK